MFDGSCLKISDHIVNISTEDDKLKFGRVVFLFRYKRKSVVLPPYEHEYRHGFQHMCPKWVMAFIQTAVIIYEYER